MSAQLRQWVIRALARRLGRDEADIDVDRPFHDYGLQSRDAVGLSGELGELLGRPVDPTCLYDHPCVADLVAHLTDAPADGARRPPDRPADRPTVHAEPIAVIGLGCRFPGDAAGPDRFWRMLVEGRDGIGEAPADRWPDHRDALNARPGIGERVRRGGFLPDIAGFDAAFFGISPREAVAMDPQQRLALEVTWEALEHAGIAPDRLRGSTTGVFVGACSADYALDDLAGVDAWTATGGSMGVIATRLSYLLGLRGPSLVVDTACSSSLVAVHLAVRALRAGECGLAVAGGVNLLLSPVVSANFADAGVLAPDGRCRTFDADADGYGRAEGCGMVILKTLREALRDGDRVLAVLRGSAVNHNGRTNGLMAPSESAQRELLRSAYADAGVDPASVTYLEAHGTATRLGDPIEVNAAASVLAADRPADRPLLLGSVKSNLGHLEAAAGVAGLIKAVLSLWHGRLPASLHVRTLNPLIPFDRAPIEVVDTLRDWPDRPGPRRIGISAFGFGGANAHAVVEEAPPPVTVQWWEPDDDTPRVHPLTGSSPAAVRQAATGLARWLADEGSDTPLADVGHTLALRRAHAAHRLAVVARDRAELISRLEAAGDAATGPTEGHAAAGPARPPVFVFAGQGGQWSGMARDLLRTESAFADRLEQLDPLIAAETGWSVLAVLHDGRPAETQPVEVVQPLLFSVQLALVELWRSYGIEPGAVVGHSMGEVAAAVAGGSLSLADGVAVVCRRSRLLAEVAGGGAMAVVPASRDEVERQLAAAGVAEEVCPAVLAGDSGTVVSGEAEAVARFVAWLAGQGVVARPVAVDVASHSPQVDPVLAGLRAALAGLTPRPAAVRHYGTVTADPRADLHADADHWVANLRRPVRFDAAVTAAVEDGFTTFIEISPHPVLLRSLRHLIAATGRTDVVALPTAHREAGERETFLAALADLYRRGHEIRWSRCHPGGKLVDLPPRAWDHRSYWLPARSRPAAVPAPGRDEPATGVHPLLGAPLALADPPGRWLWHHRLVDLPDWLAAHRVDGLPTMSLAAYGELALAAAEQAGLAPVVVRDLTVERPLPLPGPVRLQTVLDTAHLPADLRIYARTEDGDWLPYASARLHADPGRAPVTGARDDGLSQEFSDSVELAVPDFYRELADAGLDLADAARPIRRLRRGAGTARAELTADGYAVRPALLDGCLQAVAAALPQGAGPHLPTGLDELTLSAAAGPTTVEVVARAEPTADGYRGELTVLADGVPLGRIRGLRLHAVRAVEPSGVDPIPPTRIDAAPHAGWVYEVTWPHRPAPRPSVPAGDVAWLLIGDTGGVAEALAARLGAAGVGCRIVPAAELAGADEATVRRRLGPLSGVGPVVQLAALDIEGGDGRAPFPPVGAGSVAAVDPVVAERLTTDALTLIRVLTTVDTDGSAPRLWYATRWAQRIPGDHTGQPVSATLWGLGRCAVLEHPDRWGGLIDVADADADSCAAQIMTECRQEGRNAQVAYRSGRRLEPELRRRALAEPDDPTVDSRRRRAEPGRTRGVSHPPLDPAGTQLVVGGGGRLGARLLRELARLGARRLVVVTRRGLPDRMAGPVAELAAVGVTVTEVRADVADEAALAELFARFGTDLPPLRGIWQAAFAEQVAPLTRLTGADVARMFRARVAGTVLLDRLSVGHPVDDFVCFSSSTGLLGSAELAHYAAASCFLDAFAGYRRDRGLPALTIDWGPWSDGLADDPRAALIEASGLRLMAGDRAARALGPLVGHGRSTALPPALLVADVDWAALAETRAAAPLGMARALVADGRPPGAVNPVGPAGGAPLAARVRNLVADVMALPPETLDERQDLFGLGLDSLMSLLLRRRLRAELGHDLPTEVLLDHPTVRSIVDHIAGRAAIPG